MARKPGRTATQNRRRDDIRSFVNWWKERGKCSVKGCHVSFDGRPWLADLNHVKGGKTCHPAHMILRFYSWDAVFREISLCQIVCANHHRELTHGGTLRASRRTPSVKQVKMAWERWKKERGNDPEVR